MCQLGEGCPFCMRILSLTNVKTLIRVAMFRFILAKLDFPDLLIEKSLL
jgi:hypothetical protein